MIDEINKLCAQLNDDEKLQVVVHLFEWLPLAVRQKFAGMLGEADRVDLLILLKKIADE